MSHLQFSSGRKHLQQDVEPMTSTDTSLLDDKKEGHAGTHICKMAAMQTASSPSIATMTSITHDIQGAVALSNHGAHCLLAGKAAEAIDTTRRAMQVLKAINDHLEQTSSSSDDPFAISNDANTTVEPSPWVVNILSLNADHMEHNEEEAEVWQNEAYFVYSRPFLLPSNLFHGGANSGSGGNDGNDENGYDYAGLVHTLTLHIGFNLALAYHQWGVETQGNAAMHHARKMYVALLKASYRQAVYHLPNYDLDVTTGMLALHCLIQNNLAGLYYRHCDYVAAEYHFQAMYNVLVEFGGGFDEMLSSLTGNAVYYLTPYEAGALVLNGGLLRQQRAHAQAA